MGNTDPVATRGIIAEIWTDEVVSEEVGYPVRTLLPSETDEVVFAICPRNPAAAINAKGPSYAWRRIEPVEGHFASSVQDQVREAINLWKKDCLPNMLPEADVPPLPLKRIR